MATTFLEMNAPAWLIPKLSADSEFVIKDAVVKQWQFNKFFYHWVGQDWEWTNRTRWSDAQWRDYAESDNLRTFIGLKQDAPVGYYELQWQDGANVELVYFGLTPKFIGKGYGGPLLSSAISAAWEWGARRVWVHTCDLDHPAALANYLARGFKIYQVIPENI